MSNNDEEHIKAEIKALKNGERLFLEYDTQIGKRYMTYCYRDEATTIHHRAEDVLDVLKGQFDRGEF